MIKIMMCDDDARDLQELKNLVWDYWTAHGMSEPEIHMTSSSGELIRRVQAGEYYDIYLLDVMMDEEDGIAVGKAVRETGRGRDSALIYVSNSPEFALGAFSVYASGYLLKPAGPEAFAECMDHILNHRPQKRETFLAVKCKDGIVNVDTDKLMWVENVSRVMHFYLDGGSTVESVYIRQTFEEQLKGLFANPLFLQPHKSFVVNVEYVEKMLPHDFVMADGAVIPISRNNLAAIKKRYLEYLSKVSR